MTGGLVFVFRRASLAISGARAVIVILTLHRGAVQLIMSVSAWAVKDGGVVNLTGATMSFSSPQELVLGSLSPLPLNAAVQ
jgi:hypothetical protein